MAIRQIVVSDVGGGELEDGKSAKMTVSGHPALDGRTVILDVGLDEAEKFEQSALDVIHLEFDVPGAAPKEVVLDVVGFEKLFPGSKAEVKDILDGARDGGMQDAPQRRQRRQRSASSAPKAERIDYKSPDFAGQLHRGRLTDEEKEFVRNNIDRANINRAKVGQPALDVNDPKERARYGFDS